MYRRDRSISPPKLPLIIFVSFRKGPFVGSFPLFHTQTQPGQQGSQPHGSQDFPFQRAPLFDGQLQDLR